jgi:hypothetical protein
MQEKLRAVRRSVLEHPISEQKNQVVCAWCMREQGMAPVPDDSHGICRTHLDKEIAALKRVRQWNRSYRTPA